jgi:predicted TIM-barrel fold metal-dependent hydrolase
MVIDFHVHLWGGREYMPKIVWDTYPAVYNRAAYGQPAVDASYFEEHIWPQVWDRDGDKLVDAMNLAGVDHALIMPMDFGVALGEAGISIEEKNVRCGLAASRHPGRVSTFVGVDPRRPNARELFVRGVEEWGARGLKLYPPTGFRPDDAMCYPLYEAALQMGIARYPLKAECGHPMFIDAVAADFPDLQIVMLHTAWGYCWAPQAIAIASLKPNVYVELSGWQDLAVLRPDRFYGTLRRILDEVGYDRLLFASDYTGLPQRIAYADWVRVFRELPATAPEYGFSVKVEDVEAILGENASRLLRLNAGDPS